MRIALASDHGGFELCDRVRGLLQAEGHQVLDLGCPEAGAVDYPDYAYRGADAVRNGEAERAILICGTGIGMCLCANRVPGIRAALVADVYSARASRMHNDANVLCLGGRTLGPEIALDIVRVWLSTPFSREERHVRRLKMVRGPVPFTGTHTTMWSELERVDPEIARAIADEEARQDRNLELIASENFVSPAVLAAQGSVLTNKYAEGYPGRRYYGGCECVDVAESLAIERAKRVFGADHANVQPHSGTQANMAVYFAALEPGDTILGMNLAHGGHLTHGSPVSFSGIMYNVVAYGVDSETEQIDYDEMRQKALECRPKLIVVGASAYPREIDFSRFQSVADECGALVMADIAHIAGLIVAGLHPSPVGQADFVTTTTHKTLRGPRGGMVLCRAEHAKVIDKMVLPGIQGGPLMHIIAAKAVCLKEAMLPEFAAYQERILRNARALASALTANGFRLVSGGTDTHLVLVDMTSKGLTGKQAEKILDQAGITTNKNMIPFDTQKPLVTSGIRLGVPAVTTRGMAEAEMEVIAELIAEAISAGDSPQELERIRGRVHDLTGGYPLPTRAHSLGSAG